MTTLGFVLFWGIFALVMTIAAFFVWDDLKSYWFCWPIYLVCAGIPTFIVEFILFIFAWELSFGPIYTVQNSKVETPIYPMGVNTGGEITGSFILGCGYINGDTFPTYRYFTCDNGRYKLHEVNADKFDIVCTNEVRPCVVVEYTKQRTDRNKFLWIFGEGHKTYDINPDKYTGTIYIPVGSVVQSFNVQL